MALITRDTPKSIDCTIDRLQRGAYKYLTNVIGWTNYDSYPRVYKSWRKKRGTDNEVLKPEWSLGRYGDNIDVLFNDKVSATSFIIVDDKRNVSNGSYSAKISWIFSANLEELYNVKNNREDEDLIVDISNSIEKSGEWSSVKIESIITGVKNVYDEFDLDGLLNSDIQKRFVCRFDLIIQYDLIC